MRVEIYSPDGLEAAYQGNFGTLEADADWWALKTDDGFALVVLTDNEMNQLAVLMGLVAA